MKPELLLMYVEECYNNVYMDLLTLSVILVILKYTGILDIPLKWALAPIWITFAMIAGCLAALSTWPEFLILLMSRLYN